MLTFNGVDVNARRVGVDSYFVKGFMKQTGKGSDELFDYLNEHAPWIDREADYMKYRGRPIKRTKFFLTRYKTPIHVYKYTGYQHRSVLEYKCYKQYPKVYSLVKELNEGLPGSRYNHVIGTLYENGSDQIGYHSDKTRSWREGSNVSILSLGESREFHLQCIADGKVEVFNFEAGDLFILGWQDNMTHKHSIPTSDKDVGKRISLCFRSITERYTRAEIEKKIARSERAKTKNQGTA